MTEEELLAKSKAMAEKWAPRLGVPTQGLRVVVKDIDGNRMAESRQRWLRGQTLIVIPPDYVSRIREDFADGFDLSVDDSLEDSVIHELLHTICYPVAGLFDEALERTAGSRAKVNDDLYDLYDAVHEYWINRITRVLRDADGEKWVRPILGDAVEGADGEMAHGRGDAAALTQA